MRVPGTGTSLRVLADVQNEDVGTAELQVDARLALLHGADHLGSEHALVEAGRRFRVAGEQVDMVEGEFGHVGFPLLGLAARKACHRRWPRSNPRLKRARQWRRGAPLATLAPASQCQPWSTRLARNLYQEEHELFRNTVNAFIDREIAPHYARWEKEGQVSREVWKKAGEAGLLLTDVPAEYGGSGADFLYSAVMIDEMAKRVYTAPGFRLHSDIVAPYILNYGSEEQKRTWLPRMAKGEVITAIAMTEPGTGSDLQAIRTTALRQGNELVVNGQKTFITNGGLADLVIVAAKTDTSAGAKGVTLVLVETERPGFKRGRNLEKIGQNAQDTAELFFEDVRVPPSNMLGEEGRGFACLMNQLPRERLLVAIGSVAIMEAALQWTIDYTRERKAFGKAIAEFQNTRFKLAEVKTEVTVARVFLNHCLELFLAGELDATTAAMSKWWLTELDNKVLDTCLQLFGGYGYMLEYPIARAYADARVHRIYAGTTEIMKELVARSL
jgi:long-chain-acyl-CoA dehydrogenase